MATNVDAEDFAERHVGKLKSYPAWKPSLTQKRRVAMLEEDGETYQRDDDGSIKYELKRVPVPAEQRSVMNHKHMSAHVQKHYGVLWNTADKCALFRREIGERKDENGNVLAPKVDKEGDEILTRANRALSGHTLKTLVSGAIAQVNAQLAADATTLRLKDAPNLGEDAKYPIQPIITVGAAMAIEAAWIAFNQEMYRAAVDIQQAHKKKHSKPTAKCAQAAAEIACRHLAAGTSFVPNQVRFRKKITKKKSKDGQEEGAAAKKPPKGFAKKTGGKP